MIDSIQVIGYEKLKDCLFEFPEASKQFLGTEFEVRLEDSSKCFVASWKQEIKIIRFRCVELIPEGTYGWIYSGSELIRRT